MNCHGFPYQQPSSRPFAPSTAPDWTASPLLISKKPELIVGWALKVDALHHYNQALVDAHVEQNSRSHAPTIMTNN